MLGFKYLILNPRSLPQTHVELFNRVYDQWVQAFLETPESHSLTSVEDFLHCDQVGVILCHNEIVGFHLFNYIDLRLKSSWQHQGLKALPQLEHLQLQNSHAPQMLLAQSFSYIAPEWRKEFHEVDWAEVLHGLALKLLDESMADVMLSLDEKLQGTLHTKELRRRFHALLTDRWVNLLWPLSEAHPARTQSMQ